MSKVRAGRPRRPRWEQRAVFVYQMNRIDTGRSGWAAVTSATGIRRELQHRRIAMTRSALATAIASECPLRVTQPRNDVLPRRDSTGRAANAALLTSSGRPGFYLRVLEEGEVGAVIDPPHCSRTERMTVAEVSACSISLTSSRAARAGASNSCALPWLAWSFEDCSKARRPIQGHGQRGSHARGGRRPRRPDSGR